MRCCVNDEGWPFGAVLRRKASNRLMLRWLKTVVVSDGEKASGEVSGADRAVHVDVVRAVPGQGLVRADGVVLDPVALGVGDEIEDVVDLFEEQPLVFQRPEA